MTPEGLVKEKVKKMLKEAGAYFHMPVQNGMGKPSLDFVCCHNGRFLAIETKTEKGKLTLRQQATIDEMQAAGAIVLVIRGVSDGDSFAILAAFLALNTETYAAPKPERFDGVGEYLAAPPSLADYGATVELPPGLFDDLPPDSYF